MSEIGNNFEPNYMEWWDRDDLSKEQLVWLMLGINPDDVLKKDYLNSYSEVIDGKRIESLDKTIWLQGFHAYRNSLPNGMFIGREHNQHCKLLSDNVSKEALVQEAYETCFNIIESFKKYLIQIDALIIDNKLECYKKHEQYKLDFDNLNLANIKNEKHAFAVLFGLLPEYFERFTFLDDKCKNEERDSNDFVAYVRFSPYDKWFYSEYGKFLYEYYDAHHTDISNFFSMIKTYKLWDGDFYSYCQKAHDSGFIFRQKIYKNLKFMGIKTKYSQDGWAYTFYKDWIKRKPLWTLELAADLYLGIDPNKIREFHGFGEFKKGQSGHALHDKQTIMFLDENGECNDPITDNIEEQTSLKEFVRQHTLKGTLKPAHDDGQGNYEFEPVDITRFFKNYCPNTYQPQALFDVLGIEDNSIKLDSVVTEDKNKIYYFESMKKTTRDKVVLDYAIDYWLQNKHPKIGYVHKAIKDNPNFNFGNKAIKTITKDITERKIISEIQSRKNA